MGDEIDETPGTAVATVLGEVLIRRGLAFGQLLLGRYPGIPGLEDATPLELEGSATPLALKG